MSYVISFVGTKDGQGVTSTALAVADEIARTHSVLFVDADMSGTATAVDHLHLDPGGRGMNNLVGEGPITTELLRSQTVPTRRPRMQLVPGLMAIYGNRVSHLIQRLHRGKALLGLPHDFVVFDMGTAWSHALLEQPRPEAQAVAAISARVFVVFQDSPARLARSIQVLQAAQPPKAEIVLLESRKGQLSRQVQNAVAARLPSVGLAAVVSWDPRRALQAEDAGEPIPGVGTEVVKGAQILDRARAALLATSAARVAADRRESASTAPGAG